MSVLIFFMSRHYNFFQKLKIVEKNLHKLNCSYGKVLHILNFNIIHFSYLLFCVDAFKSNQMTMCH